MEVTSVIVKSEFKNEWDGPNGKVYYHDILFQNGEKGSIGTKEKNPPKIAAGKEMTYTLTDGKIKAVQPQNNGYSGGGGKKSQQQDEAAKVASMLISYGHDMVIAGKSTTLAAAVKEIEDSFNGLYDRLKLKMQ